MSQNITVTLVYHANPNDTEETIKTVEIPEEYAMKWRTVRYAIEDAGDASCVPMPVSPEIFQKVVTFTENNLNKIFPVKCMCGKGNADYGHPHDKTPSHCIDCRELHKYKGQGLINMTKETPLSDEENKFCDVDHITLTDLIKIANFLDYPYLLHVTAKYLAGIIERGELKSYFKITKEFTDEDYKRVEKENPWMNDNLKD